MGTDQGYDWQEFLNDNEEIEEKLKERLYKKQTLEREEKEKKEAQEKEIFPAWVKFIFWAFIVISTLIGLGQQCGHGFLE